MRTRVEDAVTEPTALVFSEGRAGTNAGHESSHEVAVSEDHETGEREDVDGLVVGAADHRQGAEKEIFNDDQDEGDSVPEVEGSLRVGKLSVHHLLVFTESFQHDEYRDVEDDLEGRVVTDTKAENVLEEAKSSGYRVSNLEAELWPSAEQDHEHTFSGALFPTAAEIVGSQFQTLQCVLFTSWQSLTGTRKRAVRDLE